MRISSEKSHGLWSVYAEPGEWELYLRGAWRKWPPHEIRVGFINERGTMKTSRPSGGGLPREYGELAKLKLGDARSALIQRGSLHADIKKNVKARKEEAKEGSFIVRTTTGKETRFHEMKRAVHWAERVLKLSKAGTIVGIFRPGHIGADTNWKSAYDRDTPVATYTLDEYRRVKTLGYDAFPKSGSPERGSPSDKRGFEVTFADGGRQYMPERRWVVSHGRLESPGYAVAATRGFATSLVVMNREGRVLGWVSTGDLGYENVKAWMRAREPGKNGELGGTSASPARVSAAMLALLHRLADRPEVPVWWHDLPLVACKKAYGLGLIRETRKVACGTRGHSHPGYMGITPKGIDVLTADAYPTSKKTKRGGPSCGHSVCSQHYIDTGSRACVAKGAHWSATPKRRIMKRSK